MKSLHVMPKAVFATAAHFTTLRERLQFLRGNLRLFLFWPVIGCLILALGWQLLLGSLEDDRRDTEAFALREAAALARGYADELKRSLEAIDQMLLLVKLQWESSDKQLRLEDFKAKGLFPPSTPFNISIIDRNGVLQTSTHEEAGPPGTDLSDRSYFLAQKSSPADFMYISLPTVSRYTGDTVIQVSRGLKDRNGEFDGVVLITVKPDYFTANYDEATLEKHGFLGVIGIDGLVRVTRTGRTVHPPASNALPTAPSFTETSGSMLLAGEKWFADKRSRFTGWQLVKAYGVFALTGLDEQEILAPYFAQRDALLRSAIGGSIALAIFTVIAMALSLRLAWRKHQNEMTQATYRMATEGGNEGFYICSPIPRADGGIEDFEVIDCNERGARFFHMDREDFIGKKVSDFFERANSELIMPILLQAMETGTVENELRLYKDGKMTARWLYIKAARPDSHLAVTLRDITMEKAHVEELERKGNEDALTGLPNRHWVNVYLPQALARSADHHAKLALLFIDLDGFKTVNDSLGHAAGDEVLRNVARRLRVAVRPHDHVVRLGGDEFLVIIENIHQQSDAAHVADRILHAFQENFRLSAGVHAIGTSIGISMFPDDAQDPDSLLQNADIAMYSAKTSGKRHYRFFNPGFYESLRARLKKEAELRHAIEHDQFVMYYQPRVNIATGAVSSMEALVRWAHPRSGLIEPVEFIPLAEETGLILGLGELVIDKVCAQIARWAKSGETLVPVSINVSSRQFNETNIAKIFSNCLTRHGVNASLVEIELTESTMMKKGRDASVALNAIHEMGIKLLVDDFGTGYSSLSQLQELDFDVLKVDRAFTTRLGRSEQGSVLFTAIITMAHALGMRVVAEGVEDKNQLNILRSLHCDEIQGFYISPPMLATQTQTGLLRQLAPMPA